MVYMCDNDVYSCFFFFFNDTATTEIYTLSLHDALPILGNHIKGQLIRASTSTASNYRSACIAQSKASFISKLSIALEEADESFFWLEFIIDEKILKTKLVEPLLNEARELTAIFMSSRKTARK